MNGEGEKAEPLWMEATSGRHQWGRDGDLELDLQQFIIFIAFTIYFLQLGCFFTVASVF